MDLFTVTALIIWPLFLCFSYILFRLSRLDFKKDSFSNLGSKPTMGLLFNFALCCVAVIEIVFLTRFIKVSDSVLLGAIRLFITTSTCGLITGLFSEQKFLSIHRVSGAIGLASAILGWILFGIFIYKYSISLFILILIWAIGSAILFIRNFNPKTIVLPAIYESLIFSGALLTNLILLLLSSGV